nr:MAG TPA: hypothetical protein [Caudoviricetes sp.]
MPRHGRRVYISPIKICTPSRFQTVRNGAHLGYENIPRIS